jgi:hypothetical protein
MHRFLFPCLAVLALCIAPEPAFGGNSSSLLSACKSNVNVTGGLPPGLNAAAYIESCECAARKAADDSALLEELTAIARAPMAEALKKIASSSSTVRAIVTACQNPHFPADAQISMRVPFEPSAFPSSGRTYLIYELDLTNLANYPLHLRRIDVLAENHVPNKPILTLAGIALDEALQHFANPVMGDQKPVIGPGYRKLASGETAVVFIMITIPGNAHVPNRLLHRISTSDTAVQGATIRTHSSELQVLGPPLHGSDWIALAGPTDNESYHRRGIVVLDGNATISRRYAIDWLQIDDTGTSFSGNATDNRSYHAYGKPVLAVADGMVVEARDGIQDNVPGHNGRRVLAVPLTIDTIGGNSITLDIGAGQFAHYFHLQTGSLLVHSGEQVRRGQMIARVGDSGDAFEPHLHFEVTASAKPMAGEGVPYVIDAYHLIRAPNTGSGERTREFPADHSVINFPE